MIAIFGTLFALGLMLLIRAMAPIGNLGLQARVTRNLVSESSVAVNRLNFATRIKRALLPDSTNQRILFELPDILDLLAVALTAGESLFGAIERIAPRSSGLVANQLKIGLRALELGSSLEAEMGSIAERLPQKQLVEFCTKVNLCLKRGTPLADLLVEQAASVRAEIHNQLLRQAGKNETKMLIPLVFLILPITILFAIYPSLQMLNLGYL